ncbi:MAG: hypothetical protein QM775_14485 [Pirellulales bacterium]
MKRFGLLGLFAVALVVDPLHAADPAADAPAPKVVAPVEATIAPETATEIVTPGTATKAEDDWRFVWKDGLWWYYMPDESWRVHVDGQWITYDDYSAAYAQAQAEAQSQAQAAAAARAQQYYSSLPRRSSYTYSTRGYDNRPRVSVGIGLGSGSLYLGSPYSGYGYPYGYPYGGGYGSPYGYGNGYPYGGYGTGYRGFGGGYPGYYGGRSGVTFGIGIY